MLILPLRNSLQYIKAIKETRKDPLTSTGNRLGLIEDLNYHFNLSARYNSPLSVLFLDIDYFKKINDQYGHIVGDKILINFASILKNLVRKSDMVYRFGGEEFLVLLYQCEETMVTNIAEKIIKVSYGHYNRIGFGIFSHVIRNFEGLIAVFFSECFLQFKNIKFLRNSNVRFYQFTI
mgnify:CR=1 FL=1